MTGPLAVSAEAQAYTAAAGEARMSGLNVTIMAIAGSGNHGITNFVGVLSAAEALGASEEQTATALAISSMLTIYIKAHIKRMTAFCGCGVWYKLRSCCFLPRSRGSTGMVSRA